MTKKLDKVDALAGRIQHTLNAAGLPVTIDVSESGVSIHCDGLDHGERLITSLVTLPANVLTTSLGDVVDCVRKGLKQFQVTDAWELLIYCERAGLSVKLSDVQDAIQVVVLLGVAKERRGEGVFEYIGGV